MRDKNWFKTGIILIFTIGIILRLLLYLKALPPWHDEVCLAVNIMERSYSGLFSGLDYLQVAPPFFLVISKFILNIFHPQTDITCAMVLRLLPAAAGIAAIPAFYKFLKTVSENKYVILAGMFIFSFAPVTILYCAQIKQYSTELLYSILLLTAFYKIIFQKKKCFSIYPLLIFAPWFSFSSFFIICAGFITLLLKKEFLELLKLIFPFLLSTVFFYIFSLHNIISINYAGMNSYWSGGYSFFSLRHPLRVIYRFGECWAFTKFAYTAFGIVAAAGWISFIFSKENPIKKLYFMTPLLLMFAASSMHLYPMQQRLILFLFPICAYTIAFISFKYFRIILIIFCLAAFIQSVNFIINPWMIRNSLKDVVDYACSNMSAKDKIIVDKDEVDYLYYIKFKSTQPFVINLRINCMTNKEQCRAKLEEIISSEISYDSSCWFLVNSYADVDYITERMEILDELRLWSTAIKIKSIKT